MAALLPTADDAGAGLGAPGFTDCPGFPDVIVISFRWVEEYFASAERAAIVWSSSPADAEETRAWLERELRRKGLSPLHLSLLPDEELRGLVNDLCFTHAFSSEEQVVLAS